MGRNDPRTRNEPCIVASRCGLDAVLLSTPEYEDSLRLAYKAYHVFKYADRPVLQFQCQVTLCLKYDGGCSGITPPKCPETAAHHLHQHMGRKRAKLRRSRELVAQTRHDPDQTFDLFTKPLMVVDEQFADVLNCPAKDQPMYTLSQNMPSVALICLSAVSLLCSGATIAYWIRRRFVHTLRVKT